MNTHYIIDNPKQSLRRVLCMVVSLSLPALIATTEAKASVAKPGDTNSGVATNSPQKGRKVIGVVTDSKTGEPIIGAAIMLKGTKTGTVTDIDGKFEIYANQGDFLEISFLGYASKSVKVDKTTILTITLAESAKKLDDVVITAFGTGQKKVTVTGSIQTVRPSELKMPGSNLSSAFAGRIAGVTSFQRSGEPGHDASNFYIRGIATTSGVTSPLIILDGVEASQGDLNALDPEVIGEFSVLKDASSTAMYGSRGANGVIIVTTKRGSDLERPVIGVRLENWVNTPVQVPKIANAETYMRMYNEAVTNQGTGALLYTEDFINGVREGKDPYIYPNVDWYKEIFKEATWNQRANMNIRGGTSKITYFLNMNVTHEEGMLRGRSKDFFSYDNNINLMKYAFQNNVDFHLSPSAKIALHLNASMVDSRGPITASNGTGGIGEMFNAIMNTNPVDFPIMFPKGNDQWIHWGGKQSGSTNPTNPLALATTGYNDNFQSTVIANLSYDQKLDFITKGLKFNAMVSFKNWTSSTKFRYQDYNKYRLDTKPQNEDGTYNQKPIGGDPTKHNLGTGGSSNGDRTFYFQTSLDWNRKFGRHSVGALAIYNQREYNINIYGTDLISSLPQRRQNIAGRLTYDYDHRYMLEFNAALNGTENFAAGHRFGFFPALSAGWAVSEEPFWKSLKNSISLLKLRASYGTVGNDQIGGSRFIYRPIVRLNGSGTYKTGFDGGYESHNGPTFNRLENLGITWEVATKFNAGIDLKLFKDFSINADVFREVRSNIFQRRESIPSYLGADGVDIYGNFSKMENKGLEMTLEYNKQVNKDLYVQARGTFNYAHNTILEKDEAPGTRPALSAIGKSANTYFGYVSKGLYIDEADIAHNPKSTINNIAVAPGDIKYIDQPDKDGKYDGIINEDDRIAMGWPKVPEIQYGLLLTAKYKKFDFSMQWFGQTHASLMMKGLEPFGTQLNRNVLQWVADNYWTKNRQNPDALYPRLTQYNNNHNTAASSHWLRDASFLKLRSVEVGFNYKLARFYLNATNLLTIAPFKLWDPEMGEGRGMSYPLQRSFNLGVQLTFK